MCNGVMVNEDCNHFLYECYKYYQGRPPRDVAENYVDIFLRGTNVTDFVINIGSNLQSQYPSNVNEDYIDKYLQKTENGKSVDYANTWVASAYDLFVRQGLDYLAVWIERCRALGITPWLSLRMNDCHNNDDETSIALTNYHHEHHEYRRVRHRPVKGYFDNCFDYFVPEYRARVLKYIAEAVERYDADGFELDWMREPFCFPVGREVEGAAVIHEFTREARAILNDAERKWGHKIRLSARVPADPVKALEFGYDVATWAREGLIDTVIPSPRWASANSDIPVEFWRTLLHDTPVSICPCLEVLIKARPDNRHFNTYREHYAAMAAAYLSMGADKIYLFNYMYDTNPDEKRFGEGVAKVSSHSPYADKAVFREWLTLMGDAEMAVNAERTHMVTYNDIGPEWYYWDVARFAPLPVVSRNRADAKFIRIRVGKIPADARVWLRLAADRAPMDVFASSESVSYRETIEDFDRRFTENPLYVYEIRNDGNLPPFIVAEFSAGDEPLTVDYADVYVNRSCD